MSEWTLTGMMADGVRIRVRGCDHWEFRDGKVIRKDSYWKIVSQNEKRLQGLQVSGFRRLKT